MEFDKEVKDMKLEEQTFKDSQGNKLSLHQLCCTEPMQTKKIILRLEQSLAEAKKDRKISHKLDREMYKLNDSFIHQNVNLKKQLAAMRECIDRTKEGITMLYDMENEEARKMGLKDALSVVKEEIELLQKEGK